MRLETNTFEDTIVTLSEANVRELAALIELESASRAAGRLLSDSTRQLYKKQEGRTGFLIVRVEDDADHYRHRLEG